MIAPNTSAGATLTPTGEGLYSPHPLAPDFGLLIRSDDMAPAYRNGDTVLVRRLRKGERMARRADYLFSHRAPKGSLESVTVCVAHLRSTTRTHWICERYGAGPRRLPRRQWPVVYVVVGRYNTSNAVLRDKAPA